MTQATNGIVPVQFYYIRSVNSGLYVTPNSNESGAKLTQEALDGPTSYATNQMWAFIEYDSGSGIYRIFNVLNSFSIDVKDAEAKDEAVIQQYEWRSGQANQLWAYNVQTKWFQTQIPSKNVMVMDVKGESTKAGAAIQLHAAGNNQANQQWNLIPVTTVGK